MEVNKEIISHRLFIGGLFNDITAKDIRDRFGSFGHIQNIQIIQRKDDNGKIVKTFCYVDIDAALPTVNKCMSLYSKSKWKGHEIKVQSAKESYLARLEKEWKNRDSKEIAIEDLPRTPSKDYKEITRKVVKMKAVVPGTKISDEPNWIIGKYGRPLPIVRLRHRNSKILKFDPSKHCHQLKKLVDTSNDAEDRLAELSWSLEEIDAKEDGREEQRKRHRKEFSDRGGIGRESPVVDRSCRLSEKKARKISKKDLDCVDHENRPVMDSKFYLPTQCDADFECTENVMKEKKVDERRLPKTDKNSLRIDNFTQNESNEEVRTQPMLIESSRVLQREADANLEKTENDLNYKKAHNTITDFSSKDLKIIDILTEMDSVMDNTGSANELELSQTAKQIELNEEAGSDVRCLGESIVSQILKMRTKSHGNDGDSTLQNDIDNIIVKENSGKTVPVSNQHVHAESDDGSGDGDGLEDRNEGCRSCELNSQKSESDCDDIFCNNGDEIFVDRQESSNVEETSSEGSNDTMDNFGMSKNDSRAMDYESNINQSELLNSDTISIEDGEVSAQRHHSLHGTANVKVNNERDGNEKALPSGKMNLTQSMFEANSLKKIQSEEKRLHSLSERKKTELNQRNVVKLALKSEKLNSKSSKHIQFGSSDEDDNYTNNVSEEITNEKKVSGNAALSWLGLDDSNDNSNDHDHLGVDSDDDSKRFEIKKQFEGFKGAELFKLHKKAALDERFKIDARFLHSGSEDENNGTDDGEVPMNVDHELAVEKSRALSILDDLLGKASPAVQKDASAKTKNINNVVRYDPLDAMHAEYENTQERNESETDTIEQSANETTAPSDRPYPEVAKEAYYSVSTDLKGLFATPETTAFSFLSSDVSSNTKDTHNFLAETTTLEVKKYGTSLQKFDDESGDEEMSSEEKHTKMDAIIERSGRNIDTLFFFTEDDPRLKSDAVDCPSGFMRKESIDELYLQLEANREGLRQDFKRKQKDAIRRQRKKESVKNKIEI